MSLKKFKWDSFGNGVAFTILVFGLVFAFAKPALPGKGPPEAKPPEVARKAPVGAPKENCEQYYEKAKQYLQEGLGFHAASSAAYSLMYQNCLARNKR